MDSPSSPPVLYLGDDDDSDQNRYFNRNISLPTASTSNDMNMPRKKRKITDTNVRVNPSIVNWSKRHRNDHNQQRSSDHFTDPDPDPEPILLDPDEYVIEELDTQSFCAFDWTIAPRPQPQPPPPPPPSLLSTTKPSNPIPPMPKVSIAPTSNLAKRSVDKTAITSFSPITNQKNNFIQQQEKPMSIPVLPPPPSSSLPLPKPTSSFVRPTVQRGRPTKNSRVLYTQSTSLTSPVCQRTEQQVFPPTQPTSRPSPPAPTIVPTSSTSEIRRQALNGTSIFSAFHDSKYYRCNICKFKSLTSPTLLQHLFTHMFFCHQCSFYTYSHYNLSQHMFEKHNSNLTKEINDPLNPKSFDLLYITRCADGTFALCMDSSSSPSSSTTTTITTNKINNNTDQRLSIPSAIVNDDHHHQIEPSRKKLMKQKDVPKEDENDVMPITEKRTINNRSLVCSTGKGKQNQTFVLMKHRRCYSIRKPRCLHSLTLEYNICREHTIRHMCRTQGILKPRKFLTKFNTTRTIDEVANCLRTIVNQVVDSEEKSNQSSLICTLPNHLLQPIISNGDLNNLISSLKLKNRYERHNEENQLYENEHVLRRSREHIYILSSPETNHNEQSIISSLHSSMTNGDSFFTQTKLNKLPISYENTYRFLKGNLNIQPRLNNLNSKVQKKDDTTQSPPKLVPLRPVIPKPARYLTNPLFPTTVNRNNNPVTSSKPKIETRKLSNVIILD